MNMQAIANILNAAVNDLREDNDRYTNSHDNSGREKTKSSKPRRPWQEEKKQKESVRTNKRDIWS